MYRISLDLKNLSYKNAGIGRYCINLSQQIAKFDTLNCFGITSPATNFKIFKSLKLKNYKFFPFQSSLIRSLFIPIILPNNIQIHHSFDNSCIFPISNKIKKITTIHDVLVYIYPEYFEFKHRNVVRYMTKKAIFSSDHIITDSHSTKKEILEIFPKIKPEKITVIHLAADDQSSYLKKKKFKPLRGFPSNYLLTVGTLEPRKNLKRLLDAFSSYKSNKKKSDLHLVIAGGKGWLKSGISSDNDKLKKNNIINLGYVEEEMLQSLYSHASAFIYPSIHEGFGLPPLEAMSYGVPTIMSKTSSLTEVGGEAAIYFDPFSVHSIKSAIEKLFSNLELRKILSKKSFNQSSKFSWEKTASETFNVYQKVLDL